MACYLTEKEIKYMVDDEKRKLGGKERKEPLWGVHVRSESEIHEMIKQVRQLLLHTHNITDTNVHHVQQKQTASTTFQK